MVPADSHRVPRAPRYSGYRYASRNCGYGAVILCGAAFQRLPLDTQVQSPGPTTPARPTGDARRFGLFPVRSPLLGESLLFSLPGGTKMFQFPPFAPPACAGGDRPSGGRVVPFGHPRVNGRLRLAVDFRSLPRPSSPPRAKASAMRPNSLPCAHARQQAGRAAVSRCKCISSLSSYFPSVARRYGGGLVSTTVLLVQHAKDRCLACSTEAGWRITDSNR